MFCDKDNVNQLTAQLINAGIRHIVVCPGSRNAVMIHNFNEVAENSGAFCLHPITDERSAAFFAIGLWLAERNPVAICVTSGSALLNTLPGVAEACYRQIPLVIISADRPPQWINQLDGQTIPQPDALYPYAECVEMMEHPSRVSVPVYNPLKPLHINVPISEPLFSFTTRELPTPEYSFFERWPDIDAGIEHLNAIVDMLNEARLPAVIVGQYEGEAIPSLARMDRDNKILLLPEVISNQPGSKRTSWIESLRAEGIDMPDVVVHFGGALVNKWLKLKLRQTEGVRVIRVDETDECPDTFSHLEMKVKYNERTFFDILEPLLHPNDNIRQFKGLADCSCEPLNTKEHAVGLLYNTLLASDHTNQVLFLGNSSSVRAAARVVPSATIPIYCNRGVNGIEGSLSVAAGYSAVSERNTYVVLGDLSFFYDCNALWNSQLGNNLRIILLNDHGGGIFKTLPGLDASPATSELVMARHNTSAEGIAQSYHCHYFGAKNMAEYQTALRELKTYNDTKPFIIEYDTNLEQD